MQFTKKLVRMALVPALGGAFLAGGCGGGYGSSDATPEVGQQRKDARIKEYGAAGIPTGKGSRVDPQAAARSKAQGGR